MQKTERVEAEILNFGKKHRKMKYLCVFCIFVVLGVSYFYRYIASNGKRYVAIAFVGMFFLTSGSFAFVEQNQKLKVDVSQCVEEPVVSLEPTKSLMLSGDQDLSLEAAMQLDEEGTAAKSDDYYGEQIDAEVTTYTIEEILEEMDADTVTAVNESENAEVSMDRDAWNLILVNKQHSVPEDYEVTLRNVVGDKMCDERVIPELLQMMQDAKADGVTLMICSAYRSYEYQVGLFEKKIRAYMNRGFSYMDAYQLSAQAVTVPGYSEHQLGLSFDIVTPTHTSLDFAFGETKAGKWLAENGYRYGFILRYPEGKEYVTGIEYEPWHYRYVGVEAATIITKEQITLEEFIDNMEDYL